MVSNQNFNPEQPNNPIYSDLKAENEAVKIERLKLKLFERALPALIQAIDTELASGSHNIRSTPRVVELETENKTVPPGTTLDYSVKIDKNPQSIENSAEFVNLLSLETTDIDLSLLRHQDRQRIANATRQSPRWKHNADSNLERLVQSLDENSSYQKVPGIFERRTGFRVDLIAEPKSMRTALSDEIIVEPDEYYIPAISLGDDGDSAIRKPPLRGSPTVETMLDHGIDATQPTSRDYESALLIVSCTLGSIGLKLKHNS